MNLLRKTVSSFLHHTVNRSSAHALQNIKQNLTPQIVLCALVVRHNHERFSLVHKEKRPRKNTGQVNKTSQRQTEVFQLDPLRGKYAPVVPDTIRQRTVSAAILQGITDVLTSPELDSCLRDYQIEITQVKITRNLSHAVIYWTVHEEYREHEEDIKLLLDKNADHIRRLLPSYASLNRFPSLNFTKDRMLDFTQQVDDLLNEAKKENNA